VGNPKTDLKGGYVGWRGRKLFAGIGLTLVRWACNVLTTVAAVHINYLFVNSFAIISAVSIRFLLLICMSGG
jgi:hypothetical protein